MDKELKKATIQTADLMYCAYMEFLKNTGGNKSLSLMLTGELAKAMFNNSEQPQSNIYNIQWNKDDCK